MRSSKHDRVFIASLFPNMPYHGRDGNIEHDDLYIPVCLERSRHEAEQKLFAYRKDQLKDGEGDFWHYACIEEIPLGSTHAKQLSWYHFDPERDDWQPLPVPSRVTKVNSIALSRRWWW